MCLLLGKMFLNLQRNYEHDFGLLPGDGGGSSGGGSPPRRAGRAFDDSSAAFSPPPLLGTGIQ